MKMKDVFDLPISVGHSVRGGWVVADSVGSIVYFRASEIEAAVKSINSHDALVEALESILDSNSKNVKEGFGGFLDKADLIKAQAALNLARGET